MMYFWVLRNFMPQFLCHIKTEKVAANGNLLSTCNTLDFVCSELLNTHIFSHIIFTGSTLVMPIKMEPLSFFLFR
jgi:hypothetical protein